jgi:Na+-translocating ferredoxin:NAD+ oxidoreductase RnfA subunit
MSLFLACLQFSLLCACINLSLLVPVVHLPLGKSNGAKLQIFGILSIVSTFISVCAAAGGAGLSLLFYSSAGEAQRYALSAIIVLAISVSLIIPLRKTGMFAVILIAAPSATSNIFALLPFSSSNIFKNLPVFAISCLFSVFLAHYFIASLNFYYEKRNIPESFRGLPVNLIFSGLISMAIYVLNSL